jgi:hypothetical protein
MPVRAMLVLTIAASMCGCRSEPKREAQPPLIGWRPLQSFSGRGNTQTESFNVESTQWRIKWETHSPTTPDAGTFTLVVHSAVSGRPILLAVDGHKGAGKGLAYVTEDPRLYHLVIESSAVDWSIQVEEAVISSAKN